MAFCGEPSSLRKWLMSLVPSADAPERLNRILDCLDLVVYASPETPFVTLDSDRGIVFEVSFGRPAGNGALSGSSLAQAIYSACGDPARLDLPPGGYAAFLRVRDKVTVLRGPAGTVAVHYLDGSHVTAFFSHPDLSQPLAARVPSGSIKRRFPLQPSHAAQPMIRQLEPGGKRWVSADF